MLSTPILHYKINNDNIIITTSSRKNDEKLRPLRANVIEKFPVGGRFFLFFSSFSIHHYCFNDYKLLGD